jgi:hypothetical protein
MDRCVGSEMDGYIWNCGCEYVGFVVVCLLCVVIMESRDDVGMGLRSRIIWWVK